MDQTTVWRLFSALSADAQQQVLDFMAFLNSRPSPSRPRRRTKSALSQEPFIGMWRDRADMQDSAGWVHALREREWENRRG